MKKLLIPALVTTLILSLVYNVFISQKCSELETAYHDTDLLAHESCSLTLGRAVIAQDDIYDEVYRQHKRPRRYRSLRRRPYGDT